jgi:Flp pilus assembly protein TadB
MDPILAEIYSTVLTGAPYVIGAYALLWVMLLIYIIVSHRGLKKTEKQLAALEEAISQLERK